MSEAWRYYLGLYRGKALRLTLVVLFAIAASLTVLPVVALTRHIFDTTLPAGRLDQLLVAAAAVLGVTVAGWLINLWVRHETLRITKSVISGIRCELLGRLYQLSRAWFGGVERSSLHTRIVQESERVDVMSNAIVSLLLPAMLATVALAIALAWLNWRLAMALFAVAGVITYAGRALSKRLAHHLQLYRQSFEDFSKQVLRSLQILDLTRLESAERVELERGTQRVEALRETSRRMAWLHSLHDLTQSSVTLLASLVILWIGGRDVIAGLMTTGELLSFFVTARFLNAQMQIVVSQAPHILLGHQSLLSIHELLTQGDEEPYQGSEAPADSGAWELRGVTFHYRAGQTVLRNVHLRIEPHQAIAVAGVNGSGKTTIASLLCGFYRPQEGGLWFAGRPYEELSLRELRRRFGVVPQDPILFADTIRENIRYGHPEASEEQIRQAARAAMAEEFILQLPAGYDSPAGENGCLLSGGQRQRIAIARALLRQPALLILDEPTNHLDRASSMQLLRSIGGLAHRPAVLLISHDVALLDQVDCVYTIEEGVLERKEARRAG